MATVRRTGPPVDRLRRFARSALNDLRFGWQARILPRRIALVQIRSRLRARRRSDLFSLTSATRPADLAELLALARGARHVVELGTGSAWTTIALALDDPARHVVSFDPVARPQREMYLALLDAPTRSRIELVQGPGSDGPRSPRPVDLLYIDSSHEREPTLAEMRAWTPALAPGAVVIFDDYTNTNYPGVAQAVAELGLAGERVGTLFIHRHP